MWDLSDKVNESNHSTHTHTLTLTPGYTCEPYYTAFILWLINLFGPKASGIVTVRHLATKK